MTRSKNAAGGGGGKVRPPHTTTGFSVPNAHPRIWWTPSLITRAQSYLASNPLTPPAVSGPGDFQKFFDNWYIAVVGSGADQTTATSRIKAMLLNEDSSGWLYQWRYTGTINLSNGTTNVGWTAVGSYAQEMTFYGTLDWSFSSHVPACADGIWNTLSTSDQNKVMNGWTAADSSTVPGLLTLAKYFAARSGDGPGTSAGGGAGGWGGLSEWSANPFWNYGHMELTTALLFYYESPTDALALFNRCVGSSPSRLTKHITDYNSGPGQKGASPEGTGYGPYKLWAPLLGYVSLKNMGRDIYNNESGFWKDAVRAMLYGTSPAQMLGTSGDTYWQTFPSNDFQWEFYPALEKFGGVDDGNEYLFQEFMATMAYTLSTVEAQYARYWGSNLITNGLIHDFIKAVDPGGTATDWRTASLAKDYRMPGNDWVLSRTGWDGTESVIFLQLREAYTDGSAEHIHHDYGSFQIMRGNRWLTKEETMYAHFARSPFIQASVQSSPPPSTTSFAMANFPTTAGAGWGTLPIIFTSGVLNGTTVTPSAFNTTTGVFTVPAMTSAPSALDTFVISTPGSNGLTYTDYLSGADNVAMHNSIWVGGTEPPLNNNGTASLAFYDSQTDYLAAGTILSNLYTKLAGDNHDSVNANYASAVIREFYWLRRLETLVVLDRITCNSFAGNTVYPAWSSTAVPSHFFLHLAGTPTLDGATKGYYTTGSQTIRFFTLLPTSPTYYTTSETNWPDGLDGALHAPADFYAYRLEVQDQGAAQRYFLHVIQGRDSTDSDITAAITAQDSSTWTVSITHATKGNATLILNKGASASEAGVTVS